MLAGHKPLQGDGQREKHKVQRPDTQNAPDVERSYVQRSDQVLLAQQQFCNQIGTEYKEQADAERARGANSSDDGSQKRRKSKLCPERWIVRERMVKKHHQEGAKS